MPIGKKWSTATASHVKRNVPERGGVYELKSFGELVYIGKASNLRSRPLEHLRARNPNGYRFEVASGLFTSPKRLENKHLDGYENRHGGLPQWNQRDTR